MLLWIVHSFVCTVNFIANVTNRKMDENAKSLQNGSGCCSLCWECLFPWALANMLDFDFWKVFETWSKPAFSVELSVNTPSQDLSPLPSMPPPQRNCWIYCLFPKSGSTSGFSTPVDGTKIHLELTSKTWVKPLRPHSFYGFYTLNITQSSISLWFLSWHPRPGSHGACIHASCSQSISPALTVTLSTSFLPEALSGFPQFSWWLPSVSPCLNQPQLVQSLGFLTPVTVIGFQHVLQGPSPQQVLQPWSAIPAWSQLTPQKTKDHLFFFPQRSSLDFSILDQALPPQPPLPM